MAYLSTVNAIPAMTSNTAPSGIASAVSSFNAATNPFAAFNRVQDTAGWTTNTLIDCWIQYEFPTPIMIRRYSIKSDGYPLRTPKDWKLLGSNDGVTWTTLDNRVNQTAWGTWATRYFDFPNDTDYKMYRINITANNGDTGANSIDEIEMFEYIFEEKTLLLNDGKLKSIVQPYYSNNLIPKMTSNTTPSGFASASSESASNYQAWNAFNELDSGYWQSTSLQCWIAYRFDIPRIVNMYQITFDSASTYGPRDWVFEGSNNSSKWEVLDEVKGVTWDTGTVKSFKMNNVKNYSYYRLNISALNGSSRTFIKNLRMYYLNLATLNEMDKQIANENDFLIYGADLSSQIENVFGNIKKIILSQSPLGSGITFEHSVNLSKRKTNKITFQ
ncbi:discoidin domain-containing protein [Paenibacillus lautus]|uniref:discoidin domain-containing protein n=1 Tax=Paenibacillus lautus TaxID=1401 RepID=UPI002DBFC696|nr:discoidin domain-containing protein [Paenibacillus lautus]MEC0306886.1 discoidin domain-containing protein [Paenibacillus lautus]